jgi:hypothetical protein
MFTQFNQRVLKHFTLISFYYETLSIVKYSKQKEHVLEIIYFSPEVKRWEGPLSWVRLKEPISSIGQ